MAAGAIAVGLIIFGSIAAAVFGGDGGSSTTPPALPRGPYTQPVRLPGTPGLPWSAVDDAMCAANEALGNAPNPNPQALLDSVLARVWPAVPWPATPQDSDSMRTVQLRVGGRVSAFVQALQSGQDPCAIDAPVGPGGEEPPPPPPPQTPTDVTAYITGKPGGLYRPVGGSNLTVAMRSAYNLAANQTANVNRAIACNTQSGYNLYFFGRPVAGPGNGNVQLNGRWWDISRAFNPWHQTPEEAAANAQRLRRQMSWSGGSTVMPGGSYGRLFMRPMSKVANILSCIGGTGPWDPANNPPAEYLAAIGYPGGIEEMRKIFEEQNPLWGA